jgi:DNA-binding NarL/FixJ family response regulator
MGFASSWKRKMTGKSLVKPQIMPVMSGLDATNEIVKANPNCKVLILTIHEGPALWQPIQRSGARGLVTKARAIDELTPALKTIIAGSTYFH